MPLPVRGPGTAGHGRSHSALLIDGAAVGADRDLIAAARDVGVVTLVVDDTRIDRNWLELGAAAVLPDAFAPDDLTDALSVAASRSATPSRWKTSRTPRSPTGAAA
ncbi:MAG: hypothetical protein R2704_15065 [Microthrixaceae bacterium]